MTTVLCALPSELRPWAEGQTGNRCPLETTLPFHMLQNQLISGGQLASISATPVPGKSTSLEVM